MPRALFFAFLLLLLGALTGLAQLPLPADPPYAVAHLTGTTNRDGTNAEVTALREFTRRGGLFLIDSSGRSEAFNTSVAALVKRVWPDDQLVPLMPEHPLFSAFIPQAAAIKKIDYRKFWHLTHGKSETPNLHALSLHNKLAVIFAPDDLTSGLRGTNTWGIAGYAPTSAELLARNLLLWPLKDLPQPLTNTPPATESTTQPSTPPLPSPSFSPTPPPKAADGGSL